LNQQNPKFNKVFSFNVQFPGPPCIVISAYDFDDLFGDDLIGKTTIDLDDRYFSVDWQALENKPIE
jgi:Ca2+-dependent lipid-binding protein